VLADAEGACCWVHAGVDDVPQVGLEEAAVVLEERGEVVLGEAECKWAANGADRGWDREGLADAGEGGAGAGKGVVVEAPVLAVWGVVLGDGAYGAGSVGGERGKG